MKVKFLKERKDSGALAFQRKIPKHLTDKAKVYNIKPVVTLPLDLSIGASEVQVVTRIENRNKQFAAFCAMLVARSYGYKGDKKLDLTQRLLLEEGIPKDGEPYDCETIEKYYKKLKKKFGIDKYPNSYWVQKFELAIENIEIDEYLERLENRRPRNRHASRSS